MIHIFAKSSTISFPTSWKRYKFCKVFNAFVISVELSFHNRIIKYFHTILYHFSATSLLEKPFSRPLKAWLLSPKLFTLSFHLNEDMLPERCWKNGKNKLLSKVLSMQLLKFECLRWTVWFIRKPHSNVRDSGWETAQK